MMYKDAGGIFSWGRKSSVELLTDGGMVAERQMEY